MLIKTRQSGFSLIELIVSLGVFSVVITTAVGALLALVAANEQLQGEQSIMTNLSFALDSMTREIRTGTNYHCRSSSNYDQYGSENMFDGGNSLDIIYTTGSGDRDGNLDCTGKSNVDWLLHGISFTEGGNSISGASNERILYFHDSSTGQLFRRVGSEEPVSIVSSGIYLHRVDFFVTGSDPQSAGGGGHYDQASVTINVAASESATAPEEEWYNIQTSVTQRTLDI